MTKNNFSAHNILAIEQAVCKRYRLQPEYTMSLSGEFHVRTLTNKRNTYVIKIRKRTGKTWQQRFYNEILINKLISTTHSSYIRGLDKYRYDLSITPEYLFYSYIPVSPLNGYYFYIGERQKSQLQDSLLLPAIRNIQMLRSWDKRIKLHTSSGTNLIKNLSNYRKHLAPSYYRQLTKALKFHAPLLNEPSPVLTHGDSNPKNIIIRGNKVTILDWSDVQLANPFYDYATLFCATWNFPDYREDIKRFTNHTYLKLGNPDRLLVINRLLQIPRFIAITKDSITGINNDFKHKVITAATKKRLTTIAQEALTTYQAELKRLTSHLLEWTQKNPIIKAIDRLSDHRYVERLLKNKLHHIYLGWEFSIADAKRYRLTLRRDDQKIISEYTLTGGKTTRQLILKVRTERGDDLAAFSYHILNVIWKYGGARLISRPLLYHAPDHVYIYEKTLGESLTTFIENKTITRVQLERYIKQAARQLAHIHALPTKPFKHITFPKNYDFDEQLRWLTYNLKRISTYNRAAKTLSTQITKHLQNFPDTKRVFTHGDYQMQNLIVRGNTMKIIDFDNADLSDPLSDVGNFLNQINYRDLLRHKAGKLRRIFLTTYLQDAKIEMDANVRYRLNVYIMMGIVKNINFNSLQNNLELVKHDVKKIQYLLANVHCDPLRNLNIIKKLNG